jgi:hypothetical protein
MNDDLAQMNQPQSEYVVAITWREKPISTLLRDRIHDDYISADTRECQTQSYLRIGQRYLRMTQNPL